MQRGGHAMVTSPSELLTALQRGVGSGDGCARALRPRDACDTVGGHRPLMSLRALDAPRPELLGALLDKLMFDGGT